MQRISTPTRDINKFGNEPTFGYPRDGFTQGNISTGLRSTQLENLWFDNVQEEVSRAIELSGLPLDPADLTQLFQAIRRISREGGPFLPLTGGTLAGPGNLTVSGSLTVDDNINIGANGVRYRFAPGNINGFGWDGGRVIAYVDGNNVGRIALGDFLPLTGGILTAPAGTGDPLTLAVDPGFDARVNYAVDAVRHWRAGCMGNGSFVFEDVSGGVTRLVITDTGITTITGNLSVTNPAGDTDLQLNPGGGLAQLHFGTGIIIRRLAPGQDLLEVLFYGDVGRAAPLRILPAGIQVNTQDYVANGGAFIGQNLDLLGSGPTPPVLNISSTTAHAQVFQWSLLNNSEQSSLTLSDGSQRFIDSGEGPRPLVHFSAHIAGRPPDVLFIGHVRVARGMLIGTPIVGLSEIGEGNLVISGDIAFRPNEITWDIIYPPLLDVEGPFETGLTAITQLDPVRYRGAHDSHAVGLTGDNLRAVMPDTIKTLAMRNAEGEEQEMLTWNASRVFFALINAVKELAARVEALEGAGIRGGRGEGDGRT